MHFLSLIFALLIALPSPAYSGGDYSNNESGAAVKIVEFEKMSVNQSPVFVGGCKTGAMFDKGSDEFLNLTGCCKVCKNSQACGNSCIPWYKTCHKGIGCACQG
jgi:hypothetical protein